MSYWLHRKPPMLTMEIRAELKNFSKKQEMIKCDSIDLKKQQIEISEWKSIIPKLGT